MHDVEAQWQRLQAWAPQQRAQQAQQAQQGKGTAAGASKAAGPAGPAVELPFQRMSVEEAVLATCGLDLEQGRPLLERCVGGRAGGQGPRLEWGRGLCLLGREQHCLPFVCQAAH